MQEANTYKRRRRRRMGRRRKRRKDTCKASVGGREFWRA
jgi:hypothetical protein